jgi:hypothetical protein
MRDLRLTTVPLRYGDCVRGCHRLSVPTGAPASYPRKSRRQNGFGDLPYEVDRCGRATRRDRQHQHLSRVGSPPDIRPFHAYQRSEAATNPPTRLLLGKMQEQMLSNDRRPSSVRNRIPAIEATVAPRLEAS